MKQIHAHIGPAYSCAWHLELDNRVLSAGRDKTIKVLYAICNNNYDVML